MKKITLLLIGLLLPFSMMSQGWSEDFESVSVDGFGSTVWPEGWLAIGGPNDVGINNWTTIEDDASDGLQSAFILWEAFDDPTQASDDWLITPQFVPSEEANFFSFEQRRQYTIEYPTDYSVKITSGSQTDFESYVDLISFDVPEISTSWSNLTLEIPDEYYGIPIHIAFVHRNNDGDNWFVDDVIVYGAGYHDLATNLTINSEYTLVPANHADIQPTVQLINNGANDDPESAVILQIVDESGAEIFSETVSVASTAGQTTDVEFSDISLDYAGNFSFIATAYSSGNVPDDADLSNDSSTASIVITNGTFARDIYTPLTSGSAGSLGIGAGNLGYVGNSYTLTTSDNLTSVTFAVLNGDGILEGIDVRAAIFETAPTGSPLFTPLAYTDYVTIGSGQSELYTAPISGGGLNLSAGTYVVALEEDGANLPTNADGNATNVQLCTTTGILTPGTTWVWWETIPNDLGAWQNAEEFTDANGNPLLRTYVIRPNFNDNVFSTEEVTSFEMNHSYDLESKVLTINSQEMLKRVNIYNMLGQEIMSIDVEGVNVNMNLSELNSSIYIVNVEGVNNTSNTIKIVVK
jgi:hypothetical protein